MSQGKSAVTLELLDDISDEQIHEAEAYAALYALGGYTYNNVIHEVPDEQRMTSWKRIPMGRTKKASTRWTVTWMRKPSSSRRAPMSRSS